MCIAAKDLCHRKGGSYICMSRKPSDPNMLERPMEGFIVYPASSPWECLGVDWPWAFGQHDSRVKMHNLCRVLKTVIIVVLMVTSGPENSQNKWLPVMLLIHDDDDVIMIFNDSIQF
jgi:hypothetical protein